MIWTPYAELYHLESASRGSDLTPENRDRFAAEVKYMQDRWGGVLASDPYYNPNLSLEATDFSLAGTPRVTRPWRARSAKKQSAKISETKALLSRSKPGQSLKLESYGRYCTILGSVRWPRSTGVA